MHVITLPETADDSELLLPATEVGDYLIDDLLGTGGFARVYRARHKVLRTTVAIKVLSRALALDGEAMRRFVQEARSASRISHPGVVRVLGFGKLPDGRAFQVMELVDGPTLESHLREHARLSIGEALAYLDAIATALGAAHAASIVHRDLKPANVLLSTIEGRVTPRLTDFGIAKALEGDEAVNMTRTGTTLGTPAYMSPEQALGRDVGVASDIYSFGVLAFELLTGRLPFSGESAFATMIMHVQADPPAPSDVDATLGVRFDKAVQAMMAKEPVDRPLTISDAMAALRAEDLAPVRRRRWPILAAAAALGLTTVVAVGLISRENAVPVVAPVMIDARPASPPADVLPPPPATEVSPPPALDPVPLKPKRKPPRDAGAGSARPRADDFETPPDYGK